METIDGYLSRSLVKDQMKGGGGWRTVKDVANACAPTKPKMIWAAEMLLQAEQEGIAEFDMVGLEPIYRTTKTIEQAKADHPSYIP